MAESVNCSLVSVSPLLPEVWLIVFALLASGLFWTALWMHVSCDYLMSSLRGSDV